MEPSVPVPGETICGDVRLEAQASASLGAAPLQPVFLARSGQAPDRMWLVPVQAALVPTSIDVSRFMAGANGLLDLRHPALARVVLVDREADDCVVGYAALPGAEPLGDLVARGHVGPHLARVALDIAHGLAFLHARGLVHGLLTPGTVVMKDGAPVLIAHGIAALCVPDVFGPRSRKLGGDAVAPEAAAGEPITPQSDVFAWGAILASIATGARGLEAVGPLIAGEVELPGAEALLELARRALEPIADDRPRDGIELLERLTTALAPAPGTIPPWMPRGSTQRLAELASRYLDEITAAPTADPPREAARGKRRTPLPNVAPGGATPREPDTPAGWLRPSEKSPSTDPSRTSGNHPRWPVAHDLGGGLRKRTFAGQPGSPEETIEDETPRDPVLLGAAASARAKPPGLAPAPEPASPEPLADSDEHDAPTVPAGEATLPSPRDALRAYEPFRPPRMPGPHGPPAVVLAVLLAAVTGGLAVGATIRGVQARGSFSALWDPQAAHTAEIAARADAVAQSCAGDMVRLPTADSADPFARVCIDVAEYPGWMEAPETDIAFVDAQRLCAQRGRRLCTAVEWRRACAGLEGRTWPWGDAEVTGRCRVAPAQGRRVGLSGGAARCVTPEGVFDMVGNVAEWVAEGVLVGGNVASKAPTCATEAPGPTEGSRRGKAQRGPVGLRCCADLR